MGHSPKGIMKKITQAQMAKQRNHHSLLTTRTWPSAPINQIDDHHKKEQPHTIQPCNKTGKLEPTTFKSYS